MRKFNKKVVGTFIDVSYNGEIQVGGIINKLPTLCSNGNIHVNEDLVKQALIDRWNKKNEKVFFLGEENGVIFKDIYERYRYLFSPFTKNTNEMRLDVLRNLAKFIDVRSFGLHGYTTFNEIDFEGAVILNLGKNVFAYGNHLLPNEEHEKFMLEEAYYAFDFVVKRSKDPYLQQCSELEYLQEDYNSFKKDLLGSNYSAENTVEKVFAIFVEGKNETLNAKNLSDLISIKKYGNNAIPILIADKLIEYCNDLKEEIEKIEVYYNPFLIDVVISKTFKLLDYDIINVWHFINEK
ncbi:hypothetical protein I5677_09285 [Mobilitalea sibirica]|uniref:Uncharacterized protein n=1 Tax=Mobilitalea sibirica TaxID=1462919 RepID=A0A8J7KWY5_9FIRM|nr:hypothetical protein [Mobilitalea sibirica]MBH1941082.1 hypothetical protein [Mobilitalea sibirica]